MNPNDPAFPSPVAMTVIKGLTKREYFAAMAMQGIVFQGDWTPEDCAFASVQYADALIA